MNSNYKGSFIAKVTSSSGSGYTVLPQTGSPIKGVTSHELWEEDMWVTVLITSEGYSIIGYAATGPTSTYDP